MLRSVKWAVGLLALLWSCASLAQTYPTRPIRIVAPIALYPDELLTQVLMASTYPLEVVEAARFVSASRRSPNRHARGTSSSASRTPRG